MAPESGAESLLSPEARHRRDTPEFFWSERLGRYIAYDSLKVDDRVVRAATELGISLSWDDEGNICNISYPEAKQLLTALGSDMMSAPEYWQAMEEAEAQMNQGRISSLKSAAYWLDTVCVRGPDGTVVQYSHPTITEGAEGTISVEGDALTVVQTEGRPGWFNPKGNIDPLTGMPISVSPQRDKGSAVWRKSTWKYWSTPEDLTNVPVAVIINYVTSSGTSSLDYGIPYHARAGKLMVRECRRELPAPSLPPEITDACRGLLTVYEETLAQDPAVQNESELLRFYEQREELIHVAELHGPAVLRARGREARKLQERLVDMLGAATILARSRADTDTENRLVEVSRALFPSAREGQTGVRLEEFAVTARQRLADAVRGKKSILFVMGHPNPDTDTAVAALFEAYRLSLVDPETTVIPILQSERMPDEISHLLGRNMSDAYVRWDEADYRAASESGTARWTLVDHNRSEKQRFAISIVDHHRLSEQADRQNVAKTWEMAGSCAAQIAQKLAGMGVEFDRKSARLLLGATLMDTEDRSSWKMNTKDALLMDQLQLTAGFGGRPEEQAFFRELMSSLLNTSDDGWLFRRDYKEDWGIFGFAVAKMKGGFTKDGTERKPELLSALVRHAQENNLAKNFALTIIKVVDYEDNNETVNRERICLVYNDWVLPEFRQAMAEAFAAIIRAEFGEATQMSVRADAVEFWGVGDQLSRKVIAPELAVIVDAFNQYYYSEAISRYVRREYLSVSEAQAAAAKLGISLGRDAEGRAVNLTYVEARRLMAELGYEMLSLPEFWRLWNEVRERHDAQMISHLESAFVEFVDTVILDGVRVIHHPAVSSSGSDVHIEGNHEALSQTEHNPGLFYPEEIDPATGFPRISHPPNVYNDRRLWRLWWPDAAVCIPTAGHIFLYGIKALDMKTHLHDAFENLGVRVTAKTVQPPSMTVRIVADANRKSGRRAEIMLGKETS